MCVHGLLRAYLLSILLVEALAEHVLLNFLSWITSTDVKSLIWGEEEQRSMRKSILTLEA